MSEQFSRAQMLLGRDAIEKLSRSRVALFGLGGVGGYALEALVRSGVGALDLVDNDVVTLSNLNRQILATRDTLGRYKADVAAERALSINPDCRVRTYRTFYLPGESGDFDFACYDYVVDAVDTVTAKLGLVMEARAAGVPIISAMGTGNRLDPSALQVTDLAKTAGCPLARVMRRELRRRGVEHLKVVCSAEAPVPLRESAPAEELAASGRRDIPGSSAFVPAAAGLLLASQVVRDLIAGTEKG